MTIFNYEFLLSNKLFENAYIEYHHLGSCAGMSNSKHCAGRILGFKSQKSDLRAAFCIKSGRQFDMPGLAGLYLRLLPNVGLQKDPKICSLRFFQNKNVNAVLVHFK
jgi:hypothetical protein